ncbi:cyclic nucleotide-binding domain-containing protein [Niveispirillum sp.]|uniref:cyclic nucleotide-binding domain-containing protein n=1 Tax=Niveispirillum sp. TaxID=1917217 RepID=UPI001B3D7E39|nr:cyclic nucleotide-binding domain-containing protein [Niveispirillum sp.]MBP7334480.1 cyclic nucleotide-binding domain-containing protein [Niveispirillum sp.]
MEEINVGPGKLLIKEGDWSGDAFLITAGRVEVFRAVNGTKHRLATLGPGEIAGEMGLIDNAPRSACIASMEPTRLIVISRDVFVKQLRASPPLVRYVLHSLVRTLRAINGIPTDHGDPLFADDPIVSERTHKLLRRDTFAPGRVIFRRGDEAHNAYLIQSGLVEIWKDTTDDQVQVLGQAGPGSVFGEMALLRDANRAANVTAVELTVCEVIQRLRFEELLRAAPTLIRQLITSYVQRIERSG